MHINVADQVYITFCSFIRRRNSLQCNCPGLWFRYRKGAYLSVTLCDSIKTMQAVITKYLGLVCSSQALAFCDTILCCCVRGLGISSNENVKCGYLLRSRYFTAIDSTSVKTGAARHGLDACHNKHC